MDPTKKTYEANKTDALWPPFSFTENGYFCWEHFILVYSPSRKQTFLAEAFLAYWKQLHRIYAESQSLTPSCCFIPLCLQSQRYMINSALVGLDSPQKSKHGGNHRRSFETPVEREWFGKSEASTRFLWVHCFRIWSMEEKAAVRSPRARR